MNTNVEFTDTMSSEWLKSYLELVRMDWVQGCLLVFFLDYDQKKLAPIYRTTATIPGARPATFHVEVKRPIGNSQGLDYVWGVVACTKTGALRDFGPEIQKATWRFSADRRLIKHEAEAIRMLAETHSGIALDKYPTSRTYSPVVAVAPKHTSRKMTLPALREMIEPDQPSNKFEELGKLVDELNHIDGDCKIEKCTEYGDTFWYVCKTVKGEKVVIGAGRTHIDALMNALKGTD